jgi:hypothetical protein
VWVKRETELETKKTAQQDGGAICSRPVPSELNVPNQVREEDRTDPSNEQWENLGNVDEFTNTESFRRFFLEKRRWLANRKYVGKPDSSSFRKMLSSLFKR